jgi:hypothetical protein
MRIGRRDASRRLTSFTLPTVLGTGGGGVTWENDPSERDRARSVLQRLEDRRVLYDPFEVEIPHQCIQSVREIREYLRGCIDQCTSPGLRDSLRAIQAACRQFLTDAQVAGDGRGHILNIQGGGTSVSIHGVS